MFDLYSSIFRNFIDPPVKNKTFTTPDEDKYSTTIRVLAVIGVIAAIIMASLAPVLYSHPVGTTYTAKIVVIDETTDSVTVEYADETGIHQTEINEYQTELFPTRLSDIRPVTSYRPDDEVLIRVPNAVWIPVRIDLTSD